MLKDELGLLFNVVLWLGVAAVAVFLAWHAGAFLIAMFFKTVKHYLA